MDTAPKIPPPAPTTAPSLPQLLTQRALLGDEEARAKCLGLLGSVASQEETPKPTTIEYSAKERSSPQGLTSRRSLDIVRSIWWNTGSGRCASPDGLTQPVESNSAIIDLAAFNAKAAIS